MLMSGEPPEPDDDDDLDETLDEPEELDLLVVLKLSNRQTGTPTEQAEIDELGDQLGELVLDSGVGEFDGEELGGGECTMFFCGPDVQALIDLLRPVLRRSPLTRGAQFVRLIENAQGELERRREPV